MLLDLYLYYTVLVLISILIKIIFIKKNSCIYAGVDISIINMGDSE